MFLRLKQIAAGALLGTLIATQALGQTATLAPNAVQQYFNAQGDPVASGTIDYYVPSTTTRKTTWSSATESVGTQNPNPVLLNAGGYPQNGSGQTSGTYIDGMYRQVVKDADGNTIWDAVTASTGGGSGPSPGPTVGDGNIVGTILPWAGLVAPPNYVFAYGQAISRTTYPLFASTVTIVTNLICTSGLNVLSGIADTSQIPIGAPVEASCVAPGTTVTAVASTSVTVSNNASISTAISVTFFPYGNGDGSTTLNVPDLRGQVIAGRNNMGGTAASTLTQTYFGTSPNALGAAGGSQSHTLALGEAPYHTHGVFLSDPGHTHTVSGTVTGGGSSLTSGSGGTIGNSNTGTALTGLNVRDSPTGTNNVTSGNGGGIAVSAVVAAVGSGYTNGSQVLTLVGGSCTIQPQFTATVSGNAIASAVVLTPGSCLTPPQDPANVSGGGGTGGALNVTYSTLPISIVQPTITMNYVIKVLPDTSTTVATGVASLGGMTGVVACGTGLNCSGGTISNTVTPFAGVTSLGGVIGAVTLGPGLTIPGNVLTPNASMSYTQSAGGTGVARTLQSKLDDLCSVTDYGALNNNTGNQKAAVGLADVACTGVNKATRFPGGTYLDSTWNITPSVGASWLGDSVNGTVLNTGSGTANLINQTNAFFAINQIAFTASVTRTAGNYIAVSAGNFSGQNLSFASGSTCINIGSSGGTVVELFNINCTLVANGVGIDVSNCTNCTWSQITISSASFSSLAFAGMIFRNVGDIHCYDCNLLQASNDLYVNPGTGQSIGDVKWLGGYIDTAGTASVQLVPTGSGSINKMSFVLTWFADKTGASYGILMQPSNTAVIDTFSCIDCELLGIGQVGVGVAITQAAGTTIKNIQFIGGCISNFADGISVTGATSLYLADVIFGCQPGANAFDELLNAGTISTFNQHDNVFTAATAITNNATVTACNWHDNKGYNPVGTSAAANVGASPATITAGCSPETHYVRQNGTNTATIAKGGQPIATLAGATTYYPIDLHPQESYIVTWTSTNPTYTKDVH